MKQHGNLNYNPNLRPYANANRNSMTKAEACLWKFVLSNRKMRGLQFRRQRPILNYIADFMCKEVMLIIEVDGLTHNWEEVAIKDKVREANLERAGFTILRFTDEQVLTSIDGVAHQIEDFIDCLVVM